MQRFLKQHYKKIRQAAGRWETAQGGEYFAAGVGGAITGRGADLLIIDDPHSEQDALSRNGAMENPLMNGIRLVLDNVYNQAASIVCSYDQMVNKRI